MSQQQFKFKERLRYRLDNFFSKGGTAVFLALLFLFFIAFVVMGSLRLLAFVLFPDENIEEMGFLLWPNGFATCSTYIEKIEKECM